MQVGIFAICARKPACRRRPKLANLEIYEVHHYIGSLIEENDVSAYQHMRALRRRRRQAALQVYRNRLQALLEAWRERAAAHQLLFQSRGQAILFCEAWGEIVLVLDIPSAGRIAVAVFVVALVVVVLSVFFVTLSVSVSMPLSQCEIAGEHEDPSQHPFCRAHLLFPIRRVLVSD
jgi:hypothetical protein